MVWPTEESTGTTGTLTTTGIGAFDDNVTYEDLNITDASGDNHYYGSGCTFINCRFPASFVFTVANDTLVEDCEFPNGWSNQSSSDLVVRRCQTIGWTGDAIHVTSDSGFTCTDCLIEDCFISECNAAPLAHADGIQVRGSLRLHLNNNWFDFANPYETTHNAALFIESDNGGNFDFLIENNRFKGGGYTSYMTAPSPDTGTVVDNTFVEGEFGFFFGADVAAGITGSGNVDGNGDFLPLHPGDEPGLDLLRTDVAGLSDSAIQQLVEAANGFAYSAAVRIG